MTLNITLVKEKSLNDFEKNFTNNLKGRELLEKMEKSLFANN